MNIIWIYFFSGGFSVFVTYESVNVFIRKKVHVKNARLIFFLQTSLNGLNKNIINISYRLNLTIAHCNVVTICNIKTVKVTCAHDNKIITSTNTLRRHYAYFCCPNKEENWWYRSQNIFPNRRNRKASLRHRFISFFGNICQLLKCYITRYELYTRKIRIDVNEVI